MIRQEGNCSVYRAYILKRQLPNSVDAPLSLVPIDSQASEEINHTATKRERGARRLRNVRNTMLRLYRHVTGTDCSWSFPASLPFPKTRARGVKRFISRPALTKRFRPNGVR